MMGTPANEKPRAFWNADLDEAVAHAVAVVREVRPQVVVTYDENGGYGHPDHIQAHRVAMGAVEAAADPAYRPDLGEAWAVSKVYWVCVPQSVLQAGIDALAAFEADPETKAIVMIGEIGGDAEERAAAFIEANVTKPVVGYVAGFTAPEGKTMGHAGAIVSGSAGTAQAKKEALEAAGVKVGKTPSETASLMREIIEAL